MLIFLRETAYVDFSLCRRIEDRVQIKLLSMKLPTKKTQRQYATMNFLHI